MPLCSNCGTATQASIPPPTRRKITARFRRPKATKKEKLAILLGSIILSFAFIAIIVSYESPAEQESQLITTPIPGLASEPSSTRTSPVTTPSYKKVMEYKSAKITGQYFMAEFDDQPIQITFISLSAEEQIRLIYSGGDQEEIVPTNKDYIVVIFQITIENEGMKEIDLFIDGWELEVDRGYIYADTWYSDIHYRLKPKEITKGELYFEILETDIPMELRYYKSFWGDEPEYTLPL